MIPHTRAIAVLCALALSAPGAFAGARDEVLARYANEARAAEAGYSGASAANGEQLHRKRFAGGKPDTPACTSCHGDDARAAGRTKAGKAIEPMAVSVSPGRYTDPAKVEKWFRRNCLEVLGRECTPREKADWLAWMAKQ